MERRTGARANVNEAKKREQPRAESRVNSETGEGGWASGGGGGNKGPLGPACGRGWLHNGRGGTAYVRVRQAVLGLIHGRARQIQTVRGARHRGHL